MRLRSATAIALALGLAAFSTSAMADQAKPQSPGVGQLPGNTGGEGAAGNFARDKNLVDERDHSEKGNTEMTKEEKLPGNVSGEGNAQATGTAAESGYNTSAGAGEAKPGEKKLPGNTGTEGSGKTQ